MMNPARCQLMAGTALAAFSLAATATPALAVVPNETSTPAEIVDNNDEYRGVGMFFRADGFICTGTLINPRTVLFAAHCVNDLPEEFYNPDFIPAAWSFNVNALPGFQSWFANNFRSNPDLAVYNVNRIFWDPRSLEDAFALGFIEADIALASLDTPAVNIPTWALLFSTLPAPDAIDPANGTGYHVNIVGYGRSGNAVQGAVQASDFRRRAAENMLGGFFSLDDRDNVIFGPGPTVFPQNLYQLDFDSQNRQFLFDINVYRDDARPGEGITAPGDSGGPLILDAARNALSSENLVIGTLSGGSRLFGAAQPFSSIGTMSFYQPLSLYWQYIIEKNPYRYVAAKPGNGAWEDPNHWLTLLDPAYRVINAQGQVVNGLPTTPELGPRGTEGDFGAICIEFESPGDFCTDLAGGETTETFSTAEAGAERAASLAGGRAAVSLSAIAGGAEAETLQLAQAPAATSRAANPSPTSEAPAASDPGALPAPTLANGLPGASGFVPDNIDAVTTESLRIDPRYFDVTLREAGTTTLSSTITIDRLTLGGNAALAINPAGDLTSLIDVSQLGGRMSVNGALTTPGDYTLFTGLLEGNGTVRAPFLTSIAGTISPGTMGTTGTLTIDGNLVLASGTNLLVDLGSSTASDRIAVTGLANVGGVVSLGSEVTQRVNGQGQRYTILTAAEGVSGSFAARALSPILSQAFFYEENAVLMEIRAASYGTVIDPADPVQVAYAQLFDQNRMNGALASLYGLDFASVDTIRNSFRALAPVGEQAVRSLAGQSINLVQNFNRSRMREADKGKAGGKIAITGAPLELAEASLAPAVRPLGAAAMGLQSGAEETRLAEASLPDEVAIFLAGGYVGGEFDSLPGYATRTDVSGLFIAGGIEFYPGDRTLLGLSGYFNALEADTPLGQQVDSETYAVSLYLRHRLEAGPVIDGQISLASMGFDTQRQVQFLGAAQQLASKSDDLMFSGVLGLSYDLETGIGTISPGAEFRYARVDLGTVRESGGPLALVIARESFESSQTRFGLDYEKAGQMLSVNASAQLVLEFEDGPQLLAANFAQGIGPNANFVLDNADKTWVELGLSLSAGDGPLRLSAGFDTTIGRDSAEAQVVRATATYRF